MFDPFGSASNGGGTVINTISGLFKIFKRGNAASQQNSLVELTSAARVEPLCVISQDCVNVEYMPDVMQTLQSLFTGYYLQAISLTTNLERVQVIKVLDKLNPNRSGDMTFSMETFKPNWQMSQESYKYRLPTSTNVLAMEAEIDRVDIRLEKDSLKTTRELSNLAVGKLINVTIRDGDQELIVPINIRLAVTSIPDKSLDYLFSLPSQDQSLTERYHLWRSGRINFFSDLVMCQDLIDAHKKALMNDKNGVYSQIITNANNHKTKGFFSNNPSLASASNLFVISETTAANIEQKLGGKLANARIRDQLFSTGYGMIIAVVNREWDNVTFYHRGIALGTTVSKADLKSINKGNGPDIGDILKSLTAGNNPVF